MDNNKINKRIMEAKENIREEKKKIKKEKKIIRKNRLKKLNNSKFGKLFSLFSDKKDDYSFSEVFVITIISLVLGMFASLSLLAIISGGRNYFKMIKEINKFYDSYQVLSDNYYGDIDKDKLVDSAISGMVSSVGDVYTSYNDIETTDKFNLLVDGVYEGVGLTIGKFDDGIKVVTVYEDGPAGKAGIEKDDIIKKVDDIDANEAGVNKLSDYIKNEAVGKISMVIARGDKELTFTLEREKVEIPAISSEVIEVNNKKVGYLDISIFSSVSAKQFEDNLVKLEKDGIDGLVIDVRDNNGGYLSSVSDIASKLLPKGKILYQVQKNNKKDIVKDKTNTYREYPIAIITNGNSASASEILAGVIKESYHGYVVGTKTFGKGTVQQVKKLSDGSMIKYTTQNWLTPNGNWINEVGIEPTDKVILSEDYYKKPSKENDNQLQKALELVSK